MTFERCSSISDRVVSCQCRLAAGHEGDHENDIYGVFWPDLPPPGGTMCMACGAQLREDGLCPMCESKIAAGL